MSLLTCFIILLLLQLLALVYIAGPTHARTPAGSLLAHQKLDDYMKAEKRILIWSKNGGDKNHSTMGAAANSNSRVERYVTQMALRGMRDLRSHAQGKHRTSKKQLAQIEKRMGSRPPLCSNKCDACNPCEAVQMPTPLLKPTRSRPPKMQINPAAPSNHNFFHLDYSNYQPEGWKCKCGSLIYNP